MVGQRDAVHAFSANGDGVNPYSESLGQSGRIERGQITGVVRSIRDQYDDFAFDLGVASFQSAGGRSDGRPNGGPIFHEADFDLLAEGVEQPVMVQRERTRDIRAAGKSDYPNSVTATPLNEIASDFFRRGQSIDRLIA